MIIVFVEEEEKNLQCHSLICSPAGGRRDEKKTKLVSGYVKSYLSSVWREDEAFDVNFMMRDGFVCVSWQIANLRRGSTCRGRRRRTGPGL